MTDVWAEGDAAVLLRAGEAPTVVRIRRGAQALGDRGVLDVSAEIGRPPGGEVPWVGHRFRLVRPSLADLLGAVARGPQIVTPKDAFHLAYLAGVVPGAVVAEAGTGSGALTLVLATLVGPTGRVRSFDRRPEFLEAARRNLERAGVVDRVDLAARDVAAEGVAGEGYDSVLLDLAEPWAVARSAYAALRPGGYLATYTPTYNQLERSVRELRTVGFSDVRGVELLERPIHVGDGGTRPEFEMLGHTGFLAAGRRVG
ncbi:MAG TPA: tRNA (adenine-N1)-methyltransferase [Thermoplasmata archaeon]|nr:tRNA (adenine-N1)-methyltransferase [Thermoplasmata archaeon]